MKRLIILTLILTASLSCPCFAQGYSEESKRLGQEAGCYVGDYDLDEVMRRQEALKNGQANNSTPTTQNGQNKANKSLKSRNDEYRVVNGGIGVKVTDTSDELHIYSDTYNNPSNYGAKFSNDEFKVFGQDTPANDGYEESTWGELHINENYRQNVYYEPEKDKNRLEIDEYRLPWQMN